MSDTPETDAMCICTHHKSFAATGGVMNPDFARRLEIERDELQSNLEFRRGLFQLQEQQLNDVRKERDDWKAETEEQARLLGMSAERECDLRGKIERLERERDEALAYADKLAAGLPDGMLPKDVEVLRDANLALAVERDTLQEQLDSAIMLGRMQEQRHERELEQVREQYRLSSVCRKLKAENEQLKQQQQ